MRWISVTSWIALRPEKIRISKDAPANGSNNVIRGEVHDIGYLGGTSTYRVQVGDGQIIEITSANAARPKEARIPIDWDEQVYLSWEASSAVVLNK